MRSPSGVPVSRPLAFWIVTYSFAVLALGSTIPTSLYPVYQSRWHFSEAVLTGIFAIYAGGVLLGLLILGGRLSDVGGRRPLMLLAIATAAVSSLLFIWAQGVPWLLAGRITSGISVGVFTGTGAAALVELHGNQRQAALASTAGSMVGFGLGPIVSGMLAQYGPHATVLVFLVHILLLIPACIGIWLIPETVRIDSPWIRWRPQRLAVPPEIRGPFFLAAAAVFAAFTVLGLFSALAPSFVVDILHVHNLAVGGVTAGLAFTFSAAVQLTLRTVSNRVALLAGLLTLAAGVALVAIALFAGSLLLFLVAAFVAGAGQGLSYRGSLALVTLLGPARQRGEILSSYFVIAYLAPLGVLSFGIAATHIGLHDSILAFAVIIAALTLLTAIGVVRVPLAPLPANERVR